MLDTHLPQDPVGEREFAVRAGADAEIVAEGPVVEVVPGFAPGPRESGSFVVPVAGGGQPRFDRFLHVGCHVLVRDLRRMAIKIGIRLDGQVIRGYMPGPEADGRFDVGKRLFYGLARQCVHQIEIEVVETRLRDLDRGARLRPVVNAAERLEMCRIETLDADRQPVDSGGAKVGEFLRLESPRVRFQRDLGVRRERQPCPDRRQQFIQRTCGQQRGRAAAEENRVYRPAPHLRQRQLQVSNQRCDIFPLRNLALRLVGIEVAIRALTHAPRDMDIQRQRRQRHDPRRVRQLLDLHAGNVLR